MLATANMEIVPKYKRVSIVPQARPGHRVYFGQYGFQEKNIFHYFLCLQETTDFCIAYYIAYFLRNFFNIISFVIGSHVNGIIHIIFLRICCHTVGWHDSPKKATRCLHKRSKNVYYLSPWLYYISHFLKLFRLFNREFCKVTTYYSGSDVIKTISTKIFTLKIVLP